MVAHNKRQPLPPSRELDQAARLIGLLDAILALPREWGYFTLHEGEMYVGAVDTIARWASAHGLDAERAEDGRALRIKRDDIYTIVSVNMLRSVTDPRLEGHDRAWRPSDEPRWVGERTTSLDDRGCEVVSRKVRP